MKRRYLTSVGDDCHSAEEYLFDLIPEYAIEEASGYIDNEFDYHAMCETEEREFVVSGHDRFEICTESENDFCYYEFCYNPFTGEVKFITMQVDSK